MSLTFCIESTLIQKWRRKGLHSLFQLKRFLPSRVGIFSPTDFWLTIHFPLSSGLSQQDEQEEEEETAINKKIFFSASFLFQLHFLKTFSFSAIQWLVQNCDWTSEEIEISQIFASKRSKQWMIPLTTQMKGEAFSSPETMEGIKLSNSFEWLTQPHSLRVSRCHLESVGSQHRVNSRQ